MQLDVEKLISMDDKVIQMLAGTLRARFFNLNFSMTLTLLKQLFWLLSLRDGRKTTMLAVVHPCCLCSERWVPYNV